jgi:solute carrier organic anion transporter family, member 5A
VLSYGLISLVFSAAGAYFNGTITTVEKRFKIPSKNMGIISVGNDISALFLSPFIAYYGGKSNRPRWIGVGMIAIVFYCIMTAMPHFIFGPGEQAFALTAEYGAVRGQSDEKEDIANRKLLCRHNGN